MFNPRTYVKVVEATLGKAVVESLLDNVGVVLAVPELGGDEDILTLNVELLEGALDTNGDFLLVLVDGSQIQVTVTGLQGLVDGLANLTGGRLPGTESQGAV